MTDVSQTDSAHNVDSLVTELSKNTDSVSFEQVMQVIIDNYAYTACAFTNGEIVNDAGANEGSCKIFYFAQLNHLTEQQTLSCFGRYYREDVLNNPNGSDHGNIRNFIKTGWSGIAFSDIALVKK
jgi:hypothetical protein